MAETSSVGSKLSSCHCKSSSSTQSPTTTTTMNAFDKLIEQNLFSNYTTDKNNNQNTDGTINVANNTYIERNHGQLVVEQFNNMNNCDRHFSKFCT